MRGPNAKGAADKFSNTELKPGGKLSSSCGAYGAKGIGLVQGRGESWRPAWRNSSQTVQGRSKGQRGEPENLLLFVADTEDVVCQALGTCGCHMASTLKLYDPAAKLYKLAWIVDFPLFIRDEEEKRWAANHHPFTAPRDEDLDKLESETGKVLAKAYDLVINGYECGGGSIRIHSPEVQSRVFSVLGMTEDQAKQRFGFLLDALKFGAPPHGGIALGLDRWCMILAGTTNIRDVIAFPKNQKARDLMTGAPAPVDAKQLKELGL